MPRRFGVASFLAILKSLQFISAIRGDEAHKPDDDFALI